MAAYWIQPWKLFTNTTVNETPPMATSSGAPAVLSEGTFLTHEHNTTGTAKLLRLADGTTIGRLENLATSEGPKVVVRLSDAPVIAGKRGYHTFKSGRHVDLGALKGNRGNANYAVPADVDVVGLTSISVWCDRFNVSFGAAQLAPTAT